MNCEGFWRTWTTDCSYQDGGDFAERRNKRTPLEVSPAKSCSSVAGSGTLVGVTVN